MMTNIASVRLIDMTTGLFVLGMIVAIVTTKSAKIRDLGTYIDLVHFKVILSLVIIPDSFDGLIVEVLIGTTGIHVYVIPMAMG